MEMNEESLKAWDIIEKTSANLFLTGKAGTGKTTFLKELKRRSPKRMVVLAAMVSLPCWFISAARMEAG